MLLYTYISRFPVNPHYQQQLYLRPSFIVFFSLSHKWPMFAFTSESGYTLGFAQRIAHTRLHGEKGAFPPSTYPRTVPHVHEYPRAGYQNGELCRFWALVGGAPEERRKPSGQRCAHARRCSEGVAAPLGCVIFFISDEIVACMTCSRNFFRFSRRSSLCCSCASCVSARSFSVLVFARKTTGDYFSRTPISARSWSRGLGFAIVLDLLF